MRNIEYAELVCRNMGFLNAQEQEKIKKTKILIAGCGLGSNIATVAGRTGFSHFILVDGDKVEITNLNRQAFRLNQVGMNKAEATGQLIKEINDQAEIEIFPHFITEKKATNRCFENGVWKLGF
jgi:tRNA A37 threonylcarbamoyladenosine dehydratase